MGLIFIKKAILALSPAYQEYLVTFKLMASQVVLRARPLRESTYGSWSQRVTITKIEVFKLKECKGETRNHSRISP